LADKLQEVDDFPHFGPRYSLHGIPRINYFAHYYVEGVSYSYS